MVMEDDGRRDGRRWASWDGDQRRDGRRWMVDGVAGETGL